MSDFAQRVKQQADIVRVVGEYIVNISRRGDVFLPATSRQNAAWIASLPGRIAEASHAFYAELLELD